MSERPRSPATQRTTCAWAIRKASSKGRHDPATMMASSLSSRGHSQYVSFTTSTKSTVFIAPSTAAPQASPSPMV